ncbi:hypothetical protein EES44_01050 [Streptomyces sp. ADI96-15]|nr:hypothetical protein EES44_01050 [Streptomyces sp. ADI96-15]
MIGLRPIRIGHREPRHRLVEHLSLAAVPRYVPRISTVRMRPGKQRPRHTRVVVHLVSRKRSRVHTPLAVPELPYQIGPMINRGPTQQNITHHLHPPLPKHHPPPLVTGLRDREPRSLQVRPQHRRPGLLHLQDQRLPPVVEEQDDVRPGTDTPGADHAERHVLDRVPGEQGEPVLGKGAEVGTKRGGDPGGLVVGYLGQHGSRADEAAAAVGGGLGGPGGETGAGVAPGLLRHPAEGAEEVLGVGVRDQFLVGHRVPRVRHRHPGQQSHRPPVGAGRVPRCVPAAGPVRPGLPPGQHQRGRQPLQVPLPGAVGRLVEVVEVHDEPAAGVAVEAEVAGVRVAAQVGAGSGHRGPRQVVGHEAGRTAQEGEGAGRHPADPDRGQCGQAAVVGLLDGRHRIGPVRVDDEAGVGTARDPFP